VNTGLRNGSFVYFHANPNWIDYRGYHIDGINASATQDAYIHGSQCLD
jgi:hypothetical protein